MSRRAKAVRRAIPRGQFLWEREYQSLDRVVPASSPNQSPPRVATGVFHFLRQFLHFQLDEYRPEAKGNEEVFVGPQSRRGDCEDLNLFILGGLLFRRVPTETIATVWYPNEYHPVHVYLAVRDEDQWFGFDLNPPQPSAMEPRFSGALDPWHTLPWASSFTGRR